MARKFSVQIKVVSNSNSRTLTKVMYSSPNLYATADIIADFTDKLDNPSHKHYLALAHDEAFEITEIN